MSAVTQAAEGKVLYIEDLEGGQKFGSGMLRVTSGDIIGTGCDEFRWPLPMRLGDELRVESEVPEVQTSKSRPEQGLVKVRAVMLSQRGETIQIFTASSIVPRQPRKETR